MIMCTQEQKRQPLFLHTISQLKNCSCLRSNEMIIIPTTKNVATSLRQPLPKGHSELAAVLKAKHKSFLYSLDLARAKRVRKSICFAISVVLQPAHVSFLYFIKLRFNRSIELTYT